MAPSLQLERNCTPKCRSRQHVDQTISQIPRLSLLEFQAFSWLCHNWCNQPDLLGRMALHIAASCGKTDVLEWLLEEKKVNLSVKDAESGYTALHRAIYYGQIAAAKVLIQYDSDLQVTDHEGLTPIDAAIFDRPGFISYSIAEPNEVSTWGENMNSILGHHTTHKRTNPEVISEFREQGLSIKQVVVSKYHSMFLTQDGRVFTCGNGQGGRLGHGDQHFVLVPKLVDSIKNQTCVEIAAGTDHTLMRMRRGLVLSCGLNTCHQLGQDQGHDLESCLTPRQMKSKLLKKKPALGVCAGRFHSVLWTADEIFTVGLNAGQLGHQKGDKYIDHLQPVPTLRSSSSLDIIAVSCSDAATACLTAKGHVFLLHEYTCRRIALRLPGIEQMVLTGGTLDNHVCSDLLMEKGGHELIMALRSKTGQLYVWRGSSPTVKRCRWRMKRQMTVADVCVNETGVLVTTDRGQAYIGKLASSSKSSVSISDLIKESPKETYKVGGDVDKQPRLLDFLLKEEVEDVAPIRVPGVHRALAVACGRRGRNYAVVQALPNGCLFKFPCLSTSVMNDNIKRLLAEADEEDILHDAVIQVEYRRWPVHRYIISNRSDYFHQACQTAGQSDNDPDASIVPVITVGGMTSDLMEQIVQYMYTDTCQLMTPGYQVKLNMTVAREEVGQSNNARNYQMDEDLLDRQMSAYVVEQARRKKGGGKNKESQQPKNPVKILQEAARKLGIKHLVERLNQVKCADGVISVECPLKEESFCFDRLKFPGLSDVTIVTADGREIPCHKCILASRLEYFYSMFATGWVESKVRTRLTFPVPGEALEILIDFLYTNEAQKLVDCKDIQLLYDVLVLSDQMLSQGLKEYCETALANVVSFKNAAEFLELSSVYNAHQLKETCQQFVAFNLSAVLEARILEVLSEETLQELTEYYRSTMPNVAYRVLTPSINVLDQTYLDGLVVQYQDLDPSVRDGGGSPNPAHKSTSANKKRSKRIRSVSGSDSNSQHLHRLHQQRIQPVISSDSSSQSRRKSRQMSVSSDISVKFDDDGVVVAAVKEEKTKKPSETNPPADKAGTGRQQLKNRDNLLMPAMPTQPEDVPTWLPRLKTLTTTNNNNNNATTSASPSSPRSPSPPSESPTLTTATTKTPTSTSTSLRDIMRQEHKQSHVAKRKDSKKQDKKEVKSPKVPTKAAVCPWGAVSGVVGGVVSSFRDLMLQDRGDQTPQDTAATPITKGPATPNRGKSGRTSSSSHKNNRSAPIPIPSSSKSPVTPQPTSPRGENPWQRWAYPPTVATSPPATSPPLLPPSSTSPRTPPPPTLTSRTPTKVNFSDIMQDEMEKEATLARMRQKPLTLIQLEERAMQELLLHYHASDRIDEYITVERVTKNVAASPVWHRE